MALKKKPVTGMKDILPAEMQIRDYVMGIIKDTYKSFGFSSIETPCVEHIENLTSKQGGDNEKLIFKILKRGNKLDLDSAREENDLVDGGLRYDLTLPLSRYYANNAAQLPSPFKSLLMGSVWSGPPAEGAFPSVRAVRHRHSGRRQLPGGDRAHPGDHHGAGENLPGQRVHGAHQRPRDFKGHGGPLRVPGGVLRPGVHHFR